MKYSEEQWEERANSLARAFCPDIYACKKCEYPVMDGYCCTGCGDSNPSSTKEEDDRFNKLHNGKRK